MSKKRGSKGVHDDKNGKLKNSQMQTVKGKADICNSSKRKKGY